jgi:hypothetical protein
MPNMEVWQHLACMAPNAPDGWSFPDEIPCFLPSCLFWSQLTVIHSCVPNITAAAAICKKSQEISEMVGGRMKE